MKQKRTKKDLSFLYIMTTLFITSHVMYYFVPNDEACVNILTDKPSQTAKNVNSIEGI